jgi:hypothetical protein
MVNKKRVHKIRPIVSIDKKTEIAEGSQNIRYKFKKQQ